MLLRCLRRSRLYRTRKNPRSRYRLRWCLIAANLNETVDPSAQIAAWLATASASDNCDTDPELNHSFNISELNICAPQTYTITVTWTANDACNNTTQKTQTITVVPDTEKPAITVPAALVLDCGDLSETADPSAQIAAWLATASASDNCDTDPELNHSFNISELNICAPATYTITVTWTANDACNNTTTKQQTITVVPDTQSPVVTAPSPITLDCSDISETSDPTATVANWLESATATDNCDTDPELTYHIVNVTNAFEGRLSTQTGRCNANGGSGTVTTTPTSVTLVGSNNSPAAAPKTTYCINVPTAGTLSFNWNFTTVDPPAVFDPFGYSLNGTFTALTIPNVGNQSGSTALNVAAGGIKFCYVQSTADDILGAATTISNMFVFEDQNTTLDVCAGGVLTVAWTATDACGNLGVSTSTITVVPDTEKPVITVPAPLVLDCGDINETADPSAQIAAWLATASASDNCDTDPELNHSFNISELNICAPATYTITVTWTANDACNNTTQKTQTITVVPDTEKPSITVQHHACTWTAEDFCGNISVFVQTINVYDDEAPVLSVTPVDRTYECFDEVPPAPLDQSATDNCGIAYVDFSESTEGGTPQDPNWTCPNNVTITRRWVATDLCGNSTEHIQVIRVHDTTPPGWLDFDPKTRYYDCLDDVEGATDLQTLAGDNCEVVFVDFLETRDNDSCHNQVIIKRRWEATDACGNKNTRWQYLYVSRYYFA